jgi:hypothetical protein
MFWIFLLLHIINAKDLKLNFVDWNYNTKIEIDSLNIKHLDYKIDTTIINPTSIDVAKLLSMKSINLKNYGVVYNNNILKISSNEIINNIEIIDLLGKRILNNSPNSNEFQKNINLNENLSFLILTIGNKRYFQKLYNINQNFYQSPSILLSQKDKWQFTPYKDNYRDTKYLFTDDIILRDSMNIDLKRVRYRVNISSGSLKIRRHFYSFSSNPSNGDTQRKDTTTFYDRGFSISMVIFEDKINEHYISSVCPNDDILEIIYGEREMIQVKSGYNFKFIELSDNLISSSTSLETRNNTNYFTDCEYSYFKYTFPTLLDFQKLSYVEFNNEVEGNLVYIFKLRNQSGTYSYTEITESISSINGSKSTITIEKLD